jgi:hypothetical protein
MFGDRRLSFFVILVIEITIDNGDDQHGDHEKIVPCNVFHSVTSLRAQHQGRKRYFDFLGHKAPRKQPPLNGSGGSRVPFRMTEVGKTPAGTPACTEIPTVL